VILDFQRERRDDDRVGAAVQADAEEKSHRHVLPEQIGCGVRHPRNGQSKLLPENRKQKISLILALNIIVFV
jgi:hypothetical protein